MSNEVVKYHNELNTVVMRRWTSAELNLFFSVIAKAREKGTQLIKFNANELRTLIDFSPTSKERWDDVIKNAVNKLGSIYYYEEDESKYEVVLLFSRFRYDKHMNELHVILSENYNHILNNITSNFTIFELKEFIELKSTYSKTMYRLLKQWRTVGKKRFKKEDLFMLLDVPKSTQAPRNFNARVLSPITDELTPLFDGLQIEPIKAKTQGRPITHYKFTWKPETAGNWIEGKYDKPNGKYKKQEVIPDWMNDDYKEESTQPSDPSKEAEIRAKLNLLLGIEV